MRIAGWILLVAGFVLCLSVAWAALGFLLMGVGLVVLQVVERKQRKAEKSAAADVDLPSEPVAAAPLDAVAEAPVALESQAMPVPETTPRIEGPAYDKNAWRGLVESDPELAQLNAVLADYGQHFVDAFASSYLAAPGKGRIAGIVDEIIAKASGASAAPEVKPADPVAPEPRVEPNAGRVKAPAPQPPASPPAGTTGTPAVPLIRVTPDQIRIEPDRTDATITSADGDLNEMIRELAPDLNASGKP